MMPDDQSRPDGAVPCGRCGYDLRGTPAGTCPECGLPAAAAGPPVSWGRRVAAGGWVLAAFVAGSFPVSLACGSLEQEGSTTAAAAVLIAFGFVGVVGVWLLTTPGAYVARGGLRVVARVSGVAVLTTLAVGGARTVAVQAAAASIRRPTDAAAVAALGPCAAVTFAYARRASAWTGRSQVGRQCSAVAIGLGVSIPAAVGWLRWQPGSPAAGGVAVWLLIVTTVFGFAVWGIAAFCQVAVGVAGRRQIRPAEDGLNGPPRGLYNPAETGGRSGEQKANP